MNSSSKVSPTALRAAIDEIIEEIQILTSDGEAPISLAALEALKTATSDLNTLLNAFAILHRPSIAHSYGERLARW